MLDQTLNAALYLTVLLFFVLNLYLNLYLRLVLNFSWFDAARVLIQPG